METYKVYYNTHQYNDCSDRARPATRIVRAANEDEACEMVRTMVMAGRRYIGMVHLAELLLAQEHTANCKAINAGSSDFNTEYAYTCTADCLARSS